MLPIVLLIDFLMVFTAGVAVGTIFDVRATRGTHRPRFSTLGGPATAPLPTSTTTPHVFTFVDACPCLLPIQFLSSPLYSMACNNLAATVSPYGLVPLAADYLEARAPKIICPRQQAPGSLRSLRRGPLKRVARSIDRLKNALVDRAYHIVISLQFLGIFGLLVYVFKLLADRREARFQSDHWDKVVERQMNQMNKNIASLTKRVEDGIVLKKCLRRRVSSARRVHAMDMAAVERSHDLVIAAFHELQLDCSLLQDEVEFYKEKVVALIEAMALVDPDDPLWAGLTAQGAQFPNATPAGEVV